MPTVLNECGCRVYFHSHEPNEPAHVHVDKGGGSAKIWLESVTVARNVGLAPHDLGEMMRLVRKHRDHLMEAWDEYFGPRSG
ncbi:MAG: DUF4160 domain-containing protein [Alphaproteobacteria bacterium]|nr:DUF4160 domain-containing protein [Alphaproteobacteria bacterium]